jgi:hypothetical protein
MPLTIRTLKDAHEEGYRIHADCKCGRNEWVDLQELINRGFGDYTITDRKFRCSCGRVADTRLHAPAPKIRGT